MSDPKKWNKISTETVFEKYGRAVDKVIYELPNGVKLDYYIKREGPGCGVLAITKDNRIIVNKQFRPGPEKIIYDLPGGYVEPGEDPQKAIERELLEETGYKGNVQFVTTFFESAYSTLIYYCYVATDCEKVAEPTPEEDELFETELLSVLQYRELLRSGQAGDVNAGYLCLDFLKLL